jgi:hypothetical protein
MTGVLKKLIAEYFDPRPNLFKDRIDAGALCAGTIFMLSHLNEQESPGGGAILRPKVKCNFRT